MAEMTLSQSVLAAFIFVMMVSAAFPSCAEDDDEGSDFVLPQGRFTCCATMEIDAMVHEGTYMNDPFASGNVLTWENETLGGGWKKCAIPTRSPLRSYSCSPSGWDPSPP